ncbi:MAG: phytanoyl-CoA dioxygenase family protein [bacterium]|jgi:ectoine hydroxylase-related dioxygenase (phytanoyl-CoA dioxygenase family)|nr:phytanoyl-CoA dioxygenase family protein [bacterium]
MDMERALFELGVRDSTLTQQEKTFLDENGYLPLHSLLSQNQVTALRARYDELVEEEGEDAGKEVHQEEGTHRLSDLPNKDPMFEVCFTHPRVLAAMKHVLGTTFKLSSLNGRAALPGKGLQGIHADWSNAVEPGDYFVCNSIWLLSDFSPENGATRVVPGSHLSRQHPRDVLNDSKAPVANEKIITEKAGTVVIFNAHTWHGGTLNRTGEPRYGLHSYFCRRDQKQQLVQKDYIRPETYARLSEAARTILDV